MLSRVELAPIFPTGAGISDRLEGVRLRAHARAEQAHRASGTFERGEL